MAEKEIGKVIHWYDKIGVAVTRLTGQLKVGDSIRVRRGDQGFETVVESMQIDHAEVNFAKAGDEVAIKLSQKAKEGSTLYTVE